MEDDRSYLNTDDVTIEIDDDVAQEVSTKGLATRKIGPWIRPPLRIEDVRLCSVDKLRICNLSDEAVALLSSHLNMPSYGSLKNWDSIGILLKISDHEIMSLRNDARPMEAILSKCRNSPVSDFITALQTCKRIDILYSLKILEKNGKLAKSSERDIGIYSSSIELSSSDTYEHNDAESIRTILLIHYEENVEETRDYKWLRKNLLKHATQNGFRIVDIDTLDVDANIIASVENAFAKAHQIVVSFTPSHIEAVKSRSKACRSIIYAHDLMNQEFFSLNSINKRFRAVVFKDTHPSALPLGWPRSTLVYHFPVNMAALCTKIFKNDEHNIEQEVV